MQHSEPEGVFMNIYCTCAPHLSHSVLVSSVQWFDTCHQPMETQINVPIIKYKGDVFPPLVMPSVSKATH